MDMRADPPIPAGIEDIDDDWMSQALGRPTSVAAVSDIGAGVGMVSSLYRVALAGGGPGSVAAGGPGSVVVKLPSLDEAARFNAAILRLNIREVGFYRELAGQCPTRVPAAHFAAVDPDTHDFVLVLEDLGALRFVDQIAGMGASDARRAVAELAQWHLHWWEASGPIVEQRTAISIRDPMYPALLPSVFAEGWAKVRASLSIPGPVRAAAAGWVEALPRMLEALGQAPVTLVHGDYRADNMAFDYDSGQVALFDFQVIGEGAAAYDLGYFVTASLTPETASRMEPELFESWRGALHDGGVPESDTARMWDSYRQAALFCICYPMIAALGMDLSEERQRSLLEVSFERFSRAADELRLPDLL